MSVHKSFGVINIDPHLDTRQITESGAHSGNPFRQLIEEKLLKSSNFLQFGTAKNRNSKDTYDYCVKNKITIVDHDMIRANKKSAPVLFAKTLQAMSKSNKTVGVSFDMDACHDGDGVSAPTVRGFSSQELIEMASIAGSNTKVKYLEIAETSPELETFQRTARTAAEIVYAFVSARAKSVKASK
jgi:formiminoglutamase